jgi:uncharacterized protein YkwD
MKQLSFLLIIPVILGFNKTDYNDKSVIFYFERIVNQYRTENGLMKLDVDSTIKYFTEERCKELSQIEYSHSGFYKNKKEPLKFTIAGETIAIVRNIHPNNKPYYSSNIKEIGDIMNKMATGQSTNYDIAMYCFLKWKYSPSHNDLLLSPETKRFYLSYDKSRTCYYFDYVALN